MPFLEKKKKALDEKSPVPLHVQLTAILEKQIESGYFNKKIPSERELMETYHVSRSTVRVAVLTLVQEGILEKRHGKGTFVSNKPVQGWLKITNDTENSAEQDIKLLDYRRILTPDHIKLKLEYENECYYIERLMLTDQTPVAVERHYYPTEAHIKINASGSEQIISCEPVNKTDAENLKITRGMYVLSSESIMYSSNGDLVEYCKGLFRPDLSPIHLKMSRNTLTKCEKRYPIDLI
ncbi:GntR family transcriptional regulator [Scopulibacillus darangshiensis]|uniref:GntR family transcriptional regulator n=1 Tax=Scopulibacillus darangshiensis TaxID=442528 RepID=A0A4R2P951_9BACL|nr:GntR family transcriptional regulator [Scopulibacillus darangshiensis]TCP31539.1 GntR family transcriptional regulator [Scopulibacillus darangshiensis]